MGVSLTPSSSRIRVDLAFFVQRQGVVHLCLCHCFEVVGFLKPTAEAAGNATTLFFLQVTLYCASSDNLYYSTSADQS